MIMPRIFSICLLWLAFHCSNAANGTDDTTMFSCAGSRYTYIDTEYCDAVYAGKVHDSATCSAFCETAGCKCWHVDQTNGEYDCLKPEEDLYVGSCDFMDNEESCESVLGCSWESYIIGNPTATYHESSSSFKAADILVIAVLVLCAVVIIPLMIYLIMGKKKGDTPAAPSSQKLDDLPVATAAAIVDDLEDQQEASSK